MKNPAFTQIVARACVFALGLVLSLAGAELAVRHLRLAPELGYVEKWRVRLSPNPSLIYEQIPNLSAVGKDDQYFLYPDKTTSLGFRDIERPAKKPAGVKRMVVLGDSVVAGIWVKNGEDVMTRLLETKLNHYRGQWEVWNFAVPGYNTVQEVAMLEDRGLGLDPDWVVIIYCPNDRRIDNGGIVNFLKEASTAPKVQWTGWLDRYSHFYRAVKYQFYKKELQPSGSSDAISSSELATGTDIRAAFSRLASLSREHGFRVLVVTFPNFDELLEVGCSGQENRESLEVLEWAASANLTAVDACPEFSREITALRILGESPPLFYDRYHLTKEGHRMTANILWSILGKEMTSRKVAHDKNE